MNAYEVVETTLLHIAELAETMRQEDRDELWAATHRKPWGGLLGCIRYTTAPYTGLVNGKVLCIFGIGQDTLLSEVGKPWMLSSNLVPQHVHAWARGSKVAFWALTLREPSLRLENYVDARYTVAVRWLAWLGFTIHPPEPYGLDQLLFHRFTWEPSHG